jgi:hypothetical protein
MMAIQQKEMNIGVKNARIRKWKAPLIEQNTEPP